MNVLFIGSNPSVKANSDDAFTEDTRSGKILRDWIKRAYLDTHDMHFINVSSSKTQNNKRLSKIEINANLENLKTQIQEINPTHVVALGKDAAYAVGKITKDFIEMAHPSGMNRKLNDDVYVEQQITNLSKYVYER